MTNNDSFISRNLIIPKLLYFFLNFQVYSTYTFTAKFFKDSWGISDHIFGYIISLCTISFAGSLIWTVLADRTGRHKSILIVTTLLYAASFLLLRITLFRGYSDDFRFAYVCFCYGAANFFVSALYPLLDNRVFIILSGDPRFSKNLFGRQRLFGTIGQALVTVINGKLILTSLGYDSIFLLLLVSTSIFVSLIIFGIPSVQREEVSDIIEESPLKEDAASPSQSYMKSVMNAFGSIHFIIFLLIIFVASTCRAIVGNYLPRYFDEILKIPIDRYSLMMQTRLITEIAMFFWGKQLLDYLGIPVTLFIAQFSGFLRVFLYTIVPTKDPWRYYLPLLIETLKGVNSACLTSAGARYVHDIAPPDCTATAQGIFAGFHSNLATAAAGFGGGLILQYYTNSQFMYRILFSYTSFFAAFGIIIFCIHQAVRTINPKV